ncbi:amidohydrolase family protein [Corynebacterium halotolerans]|uniref:metal-dependent hydrolase family protein n=1 Tax=Corynebacterium halotolerans TaxID=225326 RepID=UPI003CF9A91C
MSKTIFKNVKILDSTGNQPYLGEVLVEDERITEVSTGVGNINDPNALVIDGRGQTLMSGLTDAHTHFTWDNRPFDKLGNTPVEEHLLSTIDSAKTYIDYGYTMCFGAASAKARLDVVVRDAINSGRIPGPRYRANGMEIATTSGDLVDSITQTADGVEGMRKIVRKTIGLGVDNIKMSISGEEVTGTRSAEETFITEEELQVAVDEAHRRGVKVCTHARSRDSIYLSLKTGVDMIYHASYIDEESMDMLEAAKDRVFVAPAINWLVATLYEAGEFGYSQEAAEMAGYAKELEVAVKGIKEMRKRGIRVLPGGDYGFAWTPHGTYARDLKHFVKLFGYTEMEAILAATALGGELFDQADELGKVQPGYYADLILVDGDPLEDITVLQDIEKITAVMKNGQFHRRPHENMIIPKEAHEPAMNTATV